MQMGPNHGLITHSVLSRSNNLAKCTLIAVGTGMGLLCMCLYRHIQLISKDNHPRSQMLTYRGGLGHRTIEGRKKVSIN